LQRVELGCSLSPSRTKQFSNGGSPGDDWWRFAPGLLLTFVVGVLIVVFDAHALVPFMKLRLSLLHSQIRVAYSRMRQLRSILILPLPLGYVRNNLTLVAALRIGWFIKPFTHQTIFQWRQPLGLLLEVCYWFPTNIRWCCRDCGVSAPFQGTRSMVPIFKLCLSLLHSLIMVACSRLRECRSNLILPLFLVCVCNNPTFGCNVENWVVC
jgi:hypothetical protein